MKLFGCHSFYAYVIANIRLIVMENSKIFFVFIERFISPDLTLGIMHVMASLFDVMSSVIGQMHLFKCMSRIYFDNIIGLIVSFVIHQIFKLIR